MQLNEKVKAALFPTLNEAILRYHPRQDIITHPNSHLGMTPNLIQMRGEIYYMGLLFLKKRREKMLQLYIADYLQEEKELREVDLAYINTQP